MLPGHDVTALLGQGGMGYVYRARQASLRRDVAAKVALTTSSDAEETERFFREAQVLAQLDHPNIVPIYDFGRNRDGGLYYTMKLVRGMTLTAILVQMREGTARWSREALLEVFRKVCDAVAFAHSRGVMHRDLKPDNIMVGEFGEVMVMDWGLAGSIKANRRTDGVRPDSRRIIESEQSLTLVGLVIGTPQYMSPEQAEGSRDIDERSDVYSLGGILYSILTLHAPIAKASVTTMLESVRAGNIKQVEQVELPECCKRLPHSLGAVVMKALALKPEDRFQTVAALAADVDAYLGGFATTAEQVSPLGHLWLLIKRHRAVSVAALVLLMMSAAFVAELVASERRATENADDASRHAHAATSAERVATEKTEMSRVALARARIFLADAAYRDADTPAMQAELSGVSDDLRDTTWHYLSERADNSIARPGCEDSSYFIGSAAHPTQPGIFAAATDADHSRIVIFDGKTGRTVREFPMQSSTGWTRALSYSPDGKQLAVGWLQSTGISVFDAETGERLRKWQTSVGSRRIDFSPDGSKILQSCLPSDASLWDAATGRELWSAKNGLRHFFTPDGKRIVAVSRRYVRILAAEDGRELEAFPFNKGLHADSASINPAGTMLVVATETGQTIGVNLADGATLFEASQGDGGSVLASAFTSDGARFVTAAGLPEGNNQFLQIRDAATGQTLRRLRGGTGNIESMCIHPLSGEVLIAGASSRVWSSAMRSADWSYRKVGRGQSGGFFGGENILLSHSENGVAAVGRLAAVVAAGETTTEVWRPSRLDSWATFTSGDGQTGAIHFENTPRDTAVSIVRVNGGKFVEVSKVGLMNEPYRLALNRDGSRIITLSAWAQDRLFLTADGKPLPSLEKGKATTAADAAWHGANGKILFTAYTLNDRRGGPNAEEWLLAWDTDTGKNIAGVKHPFFLNCLATQPGGDQIADAGVDKIIRIRDTATLSVVREFRAHDASITSLAWSSRGDIIASASSDNTVRLWDATTGRMIEELYSGPNTPGVLFFSPGGTRLGCAIIRGDTLVWDVANVPLTAAARGK